MNIQEQSEVIANQRRCHNAKPPINHDIKYAQEAEIKKQVADFIASGREIKQLDGIGMVSNSKIYKQVNDSTYIKKAQ